MSVQMLEAAAPGRSGEGVVLRPMRWWDVDAVATLEASLFPDDPWSAESFWSELAGVPATRHYLVAEDGFGALLGYAGLLVGPGEGDVQTIAVAPSAQGQGLGARLLDALLDEARGRGLSAVLLEVREDNDAAIRLYRSRRFEQLARRRGYYQPSGTDALVMRVLLTSAQGSNEAGPTARAEEEK